MKIQVLKDIDLSKEEKVEIIGFVAECFEKDEPVKRKTIYFSPIFRHLFLFDGEKLVSYLKIIKRKTKFKKNNIVIGGIGAVSTLQMYRGRGYATRLLKETMKILRKERVDVGLLQTNPYKGVNLYKRVGFFLAKKSYTFRDIHGKFHTTKSSGVMMAPINTPHLLDEILSSEELLHIGDGDW